MQTLQTGVTPDGMGSQSPTLSGAYSDLGRGSQLEASRGTRQQTVFPPEPLTEFQKFAASTTGQVLPIFGANLFRDVPSTFAPLNMTPVPSDYVLGPGDELRIRVWGQLNFQANVQVDRSGEIYLPQVGPVHVAGTPFSGLDAQLRAAIGRVFHNFNLIADVGQIRAIQVYVTGQARRPGVYTVSSLSTLVDALFASGGPSLQGSMRDVELRRGDAVVTHFDLYDLLIRGDKSKDVKLLPGDVIFIPAAGPQVALTGSVRSPAIYELRSGETLASLLTDAGGVSAVASEARVSIERVEGHSYRQAMELAYDKEGLATQLANGDLIRVFSMVPMYRKTVTLRGNVANPGRFAWHPGMRVSDLIPDKDSLITRNYWWHRTQLGLPAPEFEPVPGFASQRQPEGNQPVTLPPSVLQGSSAQGNMSNLQSTASGGQMAQIGQFGQSLQASGQDAVMQGALSQYPRPEQAEQRAGSASLAEAETGGQADRTALLQRTRIKLIAPEIDWNYAAIERQDPETLQTKLIPFDLGKLVLQHDASQDMELQPGDVVTIFSQADVQVPVDQQTKFVTLEGEFAHAGVYTVHPGETLRQLVERAGGLTPNAYLYGSEFTRESTRAMQQARIDEYVRDLSLRIQRSTLDLASSPGVSAQALANSGSAQSTEQALLTSLRQIRATGRIVLQFKPDSAGVQTIPNLPLKDGDRFVIPAVPATVNVIGSVYDQNSFIYAPGRRAGKYLEQAGGATREADRKREFIIRADGEVQSRDSMHSVWGNEFNNARMYPGDTIVVPQKALKASALSGIIDWSQIFSQLAFGAAAVNVLH